MKEKIPGGRYAANQLITLRVTPEEKNLLTEDGFKREDIAEGIRHCTPEAQPDHENRDWQRYAERAAGYAFGVPGDLWLTRRMEERKQE